MGGEGGLATAVRLRIRRLTVALGRASVREGVDVLVISLLLVLGLAARDRRRAPGSPPPAPRLAVDQGGRSLRLGSVVPVGWPKAWRAGRWWGEAGRRVDPAAIAGAVERAVTDRGLAAELRRRGVERARRFTWERTARATLSVLAEAAGRSHARKAEAGCDPPARGAASYIDWEIGTAMRQVFKGFLDFLYALSYHVNLLRASDILIEDYVAHHLHGVPRYKEPKRLGAHEFQMFSQSGADGIVAEIFRRIGRTSSVFVEFGVGDGLENNTTALLLQGWSGIWIEASKRNIRQIRKELRPLIDERKLTVLAQFITRDNIVAHLEGCGLPREPDLVSIDIDGNDYWVWEALLSRYAPRVVVVEYNALLGPSAPWVMEYNPAHARERVVATSYYGASLKALEMLGRRKGYSLVGCDFLGVNAFFVRNDLLEDRFCAPYTSENHFEPNRLFLYRRNGPPRKIGRFVIPSSDAVGRGDTLTRLPEGGRVEPMAPRRRASSVRV